VLEQRRGLLCVGEQSSVKLGDSTLGQAFANTFWRGPENYFSILATEKFGEHVIMWKILLLLNIDLRQS